jgi:hypothetical protein
LLLRRNEDRVETIIATMATRVGSVLLLVFLVQILVTTHRYASRMAAFFDARAGALELACRAASVEPMIAMRSE